MKIFAIFEMVKTKPNEPKSKPIQTQFKPKRSHFFVNLDKYSFRFTHNKLRTFSELACREQGRTIESIYGDPVESIWDKLPGKENQR